MVLNLRELITLQCHQVGCPQLQSLIVLRQLWLHSGFSREPTSANMLAELSHIWL
jgi:hypothetical protein